VTIEEIKIFKEDYDNKFKVFLQVKPWIESMSQLANEVSLTSNFSKGTVAGFSVEHGLIVVSYTY
jgi:hypothetical protein